MTDNNSKTKEAKPAKLPQGFLLEIPEVETCNDEQKELIKQFINAFLSPSNIPDCYQYLNDTPKSDEDKYIVAYKYLMARKWKMEDATKMFKDTVAWRESHQYHKNPYFPSAITLRGYDQPYLQNLFGAEPRDTNTRIDKIMKRVAPAYKFGIHKWDKLGHPVLIDRTGKVHPKKTIAALKELAPPGEHIAEPFVLLRAYQNELCQFLIRARDIAYQEEQRNKGVQEPLRRVTSVTGIMDMSGLSTDHMSSELIDAIKSMLAATQAYYPEMSYRTFVVNCSSLVMMAFNIIKGWMDPRARNKLVFCSVEETPHVLRSVIDAENLPKFLGGECECEGGCLCDEEQMKKDLATPDPPVVFGASPDQTAEVHVSARHTEKKETNLKAGQTYEWHWHIPDGHDIDFSATFKPEASDEKPTVVVPATKLNTHKSSFTAPVDGTFTLVFNNDYSWMTGKRIRARVAKL